MKLPFAPLLATALFAAPLYAGTANMHAMPVKTMPAGAMQDTAATSEGVVRKIDASSGKITIKHGPIANLDMPPMTMVFRVKSPELLNKVKAGDTVKFHAEEISGMLTVTAIEKAQ